MVRKQARRIPWRTISKRGIAKEKGLKTVRVQFIQGSLNSPVWLEKLEPRRANRRKSHRVLRSQVM